MFKIISGESTAQKQLDVLNLLYRVTEPLNAKFEHLKKAATESLDVEKHASMCKDGGASLRKLLKEIDDHRMLEKHHWWSLFNDRHREEALILFEVLMSCNDWHSFVTKAPYLERR